MITTKDNYHSSKRFLLFLYNFFNILHLYYLTRATRTKFIFLPHTLEPVKFKVMNFKVELRGGVYYHLSPPCTHTYVNQAYWSMRLSHNDGECISYRWVFAYGCIIPTFDSTLRLICILFFLLNVLRFIHLGIGAPNLHSVRPIQTECIENIEICKNACKYILNPRR